MFREHKRRIIVLGQCFEMTLSDLSVLLIKTFFQIKRVYLIELRCRTSLVMCHLHEFLTFNKQCAFFNI